jgi:hypothetical protein
LLDHETGRPGRMGIDLAALQRNVNFRAGKTGDEFRVL